jgi:lipoprotein NlpD
MLLDLCRGCAAAEDPNSYLIFELRDGGKAVDPQSYLPKRAG